MKSLRLVFMGSPEFAVPTLKALSQKFTVVAVYTQPDRPAGRGMKLQASPVKEFALKEGISVFQPERISTPEEIDRLRAFQADAFVVAAYGQLLKQTVLDLPKLGCFNVHASLLPRWRGASPIHSALLAGDADTGVTIMRMVLKLDAGPMLLSGKTPIGPEDTVQTLQDRLSDMGGALMVEALEELIQGGGQEIPQNESQVTYAKKLTKEMERLDPWKETAHQLDRRIRALNPWPGTSVWTISGERIRIKQAKLRADLMTEPGRISEKSGMLVLGTCEGSIELLRLQLDGKPEQGIGDFINGMKGRGWSLPLQLREVGI